MRTKRIYSNINNSQKIRIILNGIHLYTTVAKSETLFGSWHHRMMVDSVLHKINAEYGKIVGFATRIDGVDIQVDLL
jgi:hypothetical protein